MIRFAPGLSLAVLLAALAAPALGADAPQPAEMEQKALADRERDKASHPRRVERPCPLAVRSSDDRPPLPAPPRDDGSHPFREDQIKRASAADSEAGFRHRRPLPQRNLG